MTGGGTKEKNMKNVVLGTLVVFGTALGFVAPASAYVYCNGGDCWHSDSRFATPGVTVEHHPDDWYFHQHWDRDRDHHWHDYHDGRGYWRGGVWITL
jgi:hypothetical protein